MNDLEQIEKQLDIEAQGWVPKPGDVLIGTVVDVDDRVSEYSGQYPVVTVETREGELYEVHCFHSVLRNEIGRKNPQPGDSIGVKYMGEETSKAGSTYHSYVVRIKGTYTDDPSVLPARSSIPADGGDEPAERPKPPLPHEEPLRTGEEAL